MSAFPAAPFILNLVFVVAAATALGGALIAVLSHRIIRSVCGLALCCLGVAGLYYFLRSPFLALMEILIYIGAVCVTIVFAVMLAEPDEPEPKANRSLGLVWTSTLVIISGVLLWGLTRLAAQAPAPAPVTRANTGSVEAIGLALLTSYGLAFELISLVLLVAILSALAIARPGRDNP
jgi:NADH:ubiquinone oxidoreductase subunit 6 (subunit J)